jgi:hypothetical protein
MGRIKEGGRSTSKILAGKRPLGKARHTWDDKVRMDLKEIGIKVRNWIDSAQNRDYWRTLVNAAFSLMVP